MAKKMIQQFFFIYTILVLGFENIANIDFVICLLNPNTLISVWSEHTIMALYKYWMSKMLVNKMNSIISIKVLFPSVR